MGTVAVLCEFSGIVRDAFIARGHAAISCDLLPTERPGPHIQGDCREHDWSGYDLVIAHPPCTFLAKGGAHLWKHRQPQIAESVAFIEWITALPAGAVAVENPVGWLNRNWRAPSQIIQPYMFGDAYTKQTCLWLRGVAPLIATRVVVPEHVNWVNKVPGGKGQWKIRSRTFPGIAAAMAEQWGGAL